MGFGRDYGFGDGYGNNFAEGLGGFFGGLFGDSGAPYEAAQDEYRKYLNQIRGTQNPFYNAGTGAIGNYQDWLGKMKDPSGFINDLMGKYQQSPWAKFQQEQATRAANNLGSASGLTGSTPLLQQAQQNAANISSEDMSKWLQSVLGINSQYGQGQGNLIGVGQGAANALTGAYGDFGRSMGEAAYGQKAGENQDISNIISGALKFFL